MMAYFEGGPRDGEVREVEDPGPDEIRVPIPPHRNVVLRAEPVPMVPPKLNIGVYEKSPLRGIYLWRGQEA